MLEKRRAREPSLVYRNTMAELGFRELSFLKRGSTLSLGIFAPLEGEHRDAWAVDALDLYGGAVRLDGIAGFRGPSEEAEYIAADRVEVLVGKVEVETLVHVGYGDAAVHGVEVVADLLDGRLAFVELVLDLTDYLLDDILDGD